MSDREAGGEVSRSPVAEWEEPRHRGTASQESKYPTSSHSATQNPYHAPPELISSRWVAKNMPICGDFAVGRISCRSTGVLQAAVQLARLQRELRLRRRSSPRW